jgi:hypothetical protein
MTFDRPTQWDVLVQYAKSPHTGYASIRALRPSIDSVRTALDEFIRLGQFKNCRLNAGYAKALDLETNK